MKRNLTASEKKQVAVRKFDNVLVLYKYCLWKFGFDTVEDLRSLALTLNRPDEEGVNVAKGSTRFLEYLLIRQNPNNPRISESDLRYFDENIRRHTKQIGEKRGGITWKYFQYFALMFTEMYLKEYFTNKDGLINDLNSFLSLQCPGVFVSDFNLDNLNKLAFMCATGSGKTLIMHVNILQYLHYLKLAKRSNSRFKFKKVIVLTPNEGLSNQHLEELRLSNFNPYLFQKEGGLNFRRDDDEIAIIDINKLKEEGKEKTVSIDSFENSNLLLVDEGHRGLSSEGKVWYNARKSLASDGFTFEYSATFKQVLDVNKTDDSNMDLVDEYAQSIIMDYSYKYFYKDGYGKEYQIYNLRNSAMIDLHRQLYLTGCLVNYYQQRKCFETYSTERKPFNIDNPLMVFVGNRVTAAVKSSNRTKDEEELLTDIETVVEFFDKFITNKTQAINDIGLVLAYRTGLAKENGFDVFSNDFTPLQDIFNGILNAQTIYADIMDLVFNTRSIPDKPRLHLKNISQNGEISMRIGADGEDFGVINVGDTATLLKNIDNKVLNRQLNVITDHSPFIHDSLFENIKRKGSKINVLIGSRKFTEGWSCWRVSTIGLINFAKSEGSQAIQMFGRGVRLKGYKYMLKRSGALKDARVYAPLFKHLETLETLKIFGVKADYMEQFKKFLEETQELNTINNFVDIDVNQYAQKRYNQAKPYKLQVIRVASDKDFKRDSRRLILDVPNASFHSYLVTNPITVDCRGIIQSIVSGLSMRITAVTNPIKMPSNIIDILDYYRIYDELELYKNENSYFNLCIDIRKLKAILQNNFWYGYLIPQNQMQVSSFADRERMTDMAIMALKLYMDRFVKVSKEDWESQYLTYQDLQSNDPNFVDSDDYLIRVSEELISHGNGTAIINSINQSLSVLKANGILTPYVKNASNATQMITLFDHPNHLYAPLVCLSKGTQAIKVTPVSLNEDEKLFVDYLYDYTTKYEDDLKDKHIFLLRNKSKAGTGFFEAGNFYPDFILWIDTPKKQSITFIDPKGLLHFTPQDAKIKFYQTIKTLQSRLKSPLSKPIELNSFIMSATKRDKLQEWWHMDHSVYEAMNVYTLDDPSCVEKMMKTIL